MTHEDAPLRGKGPRQALGEVHRAVPASGTADRDGEVAAIVARDLRQPAPEKTVHVLEQRPHGVLAVEEFDHRRIAAGERPQRRLVMRIGEHAGVDHPVRIQRNAVPVGERFEEQRQPGMAEAEQVTDPAAQHPGLEPAGVDAMAQVGHAGEQRALLLDGLVKRQSCAGERMPPPRFRVATQQGARGRLEKQQPAIDAARLERRHALGKRGQRRAARIHAHRDPVVPRAGDELEHVVEQRRGQVVDAVKASVLEHIERDALARAGKPAHENQLHARVL